MDKHEIHEWVNTVLLVIAFILDVVILVVK